MVLEALRALTVRTAAVRACRDEVVRYFADPVHRMDCPRYVAKGWQIGSGPVESACKTVVRIRMKGGGMHWGKMGPMPCASARPVSRGKRPMGKLLEPKLTLTLPTYVMLTPRRKRGRFSSLTPQAPTANWRPIRPCRVG